MNYLKIIFLILLSSILFSIFIEEVSASSQIKTQAFKIKNEHGIKISLKPVYTEIHSDAIYSYFYVNYPSSKSGSFNITSGSLTFDKSISVSEISVRPIISKSRDCDFSDFKDTCDAGSVFDFDEPTLIDSSKNQEYLIKLVTIPSITSDGKVLLEDSNFNISFNGELVDPTVTSCGSISSSASFALNKDLSNIAGDCFTIQASTATIDCQGHTMTTSTSGTGTGLVSDSFSNVTVRNCIFRGFNTDVEVRGGRNFSLSNVVMGTPTGLIVNATNNSVFQNLTFDAISQFGIYVLNNSNNNTFINISINTTSNASGIYVIGNSENNSFDCRNGSIRGTTTIGAMGVFSNSSNTTLTGCYIYNYTNGIVFNFSNNSITWNNSLENNSIALALNNVTNNTHYDTLIRGFLNATKVGIAVNNSFNVNFSNMSVLYYNVSVQWVDVNASLLQKSYINSSTVAATNSLKFMDLNRCFNDSIDNNVFNMTHINGIFLTSSNVNFTNNSINASGAATVFSLSSSDDVIINNSSIWLTVRGTNPILLSLAGTANASNNLNFNANNIVANQTGTLMSFTIPVQNFLFVNNTYRGNATFFGFDTNSQNATIFNNTFLFGGSATVFSGSVPPFTNFSNNWLNSTSTATAMSIGLSYNTTIAYNNITVSGNIACLLVGNYSQVIGNNFTSTARSLQLTASSTGVVYTNNTFFGPGICFQTTGSGVYSNMSFTGNNCTAPSGFDFAGNGARVKLFNVSINQNTFTFITAAGSNIALNIYGGNVSNVTIDGNYFNGSVTNFITIITNVTPDSSFNFTNNVINASSTTVATAIFIGVNATNVTFANNTMNFSSIGINFTNAANITVYNNTLYGAATAGYRLQNVSQSNFTSNVVVGGVPPSPSTGNIFSLVSVNDTVFINEQYNTSATGSGSTVVRYSLINSFNNTFNSSIFYSFTSSGGAFYIVNLNQSVGNLFYNNSFNSTGTSTNTVVLLYNSSQNVFYMNKINITTGSPVNVFNSSLNVFDNNSFDTNSTTLGSVNITFSDSNIFKSNNFSNAYGFGIKMNRSSFNNFTNNSFYTPRNTSFLLDVLSSNNLVYWNNFSSTGPFFINNSNSTNQFNTTVSGKAQGNFYWNISSYNITDDDGDGWGDAGSDYPPNGTRALHWFTSNSVGADWGPGPFAVTLADYVAIVLSNHFTAGINFGTVTPNTFGNNASNNSLFTVSVSPDSTGTVELCLNSTDLSNGGTSILAGNVSYNGTTNQTALNLTAAKGTGVVNFTTTSTSAVDGLVANDVTFWKFWLDVPAGQAPGAYTGTAYFIGSNTGGC